MNHDNHEPNEKGESLAQIITGGLMFCALILWAIAMFHYLPDSAQLANFAEMMK